MATWKELEAQGVKRCCAIFTSGKRCRCRTNGKGSWCDKHAAVIEPKVAQAMKAINAAAKDTVASCLEDET
jgi:hypothetical protein